jgi:photosystem II stability/assembly factor-like uncharacterized protein
MPSMEEKHMHVTLLIGTRKGLFLMDSDRDRRDWRLRGPLCESWPVFHAIGDVESGMIYAAAASEWHGTVVWRSADRGETWEQSSEGLGYGEDGPPLTKVSSLTCSDGRLFAGADYPGVFQSTDRGATWSLFTTLDDQPARERWLEPDASPPGRLGVIATMPHPRDPQQLFVNVQGFGLFHSTDAGASWAPRNEGMRADWPLEDPAWGYCVHKVAISPADPDRMYTQTHVGVYRSRDAGANWTEITEGLPSDFGFPAVAHPHDPDGFYVIPVDGGHGRTVHDGQLSVWRTRDAGETWQQLTDGLPGPNAHVGVLREGLASDGLDPAGIYFATSTGQVFASTDDGDSWRQLADYLPGIASVEAVVWPE